MKVASTMKLYITYIFTLIKLVKLISSVFGSRLVSSVAMHLVGIFYIFLVSWVLDLIFRCVHRCNYRFYIFFVSWQLEITCSRYDSSDVL